MNIKNEFRFTWFQKLFFTSTVILWITALVLVLFFERDYSPNWIGNFNSPKFFLYFCFLILAIEFLRVVIVAIKRKNGLKDAFFEVYPDQLGRVVFVMGLVGLIFITHKILQ